MTDKLFDEFVKDKMSQYDSGAPMHVWERIREKEKDDKKGFFFFRKYWLTGIALLMVTGMVYLTWSSATKENKKTETLTSFIQQTQTKDNQTTGSKKNVPTTQATKLKEQENINVAEADGNDLGKINTTTTINKSSSKITQSGLVESIPSSDNRIAVSSNSKNQFLNNRNKKTATKNQDIIEQMPTDVALTDQQTQSKIPATKEFSLSFTNVAAYRSSIKDFILGNVPQRTIGPSCPTVNGPRRNDLYIEVYGSPDYTMRSFSNPATMNNYVAQRRTSEDNRNGFSAGIRVAKNINEKMVLKAGLNYSQINERLRIINENEKQLTQIITIRTVIRAPGDTLFIRDTTYFEQTGTRYRTTHNRYRFIDIPVIFSYEFGNPEILAFSINAGPVFNITSFYRGEVLDTNFSPVKISTAKGNGPNNWRSNIGVGVFASFAVYKRMNERMQIFAEPYFRYNFRPVTQSSNFVQQRYSITGMQLGIRYNLFNERQRYR